MQLFIKLKFLQSLSNCVNSLYCTVVWFVNKEWNGGFCVYLSFGGWAAPQQKTNCFHNVPFAFSIYPQDWLTISQTSNFLGSLQTFCQGPLQSDCGGHIALLLSFQLYLSFHLMLQILNGNYHWTHWHITITLAFSLSHRHWHSHGSLLDNWLRVTVKPIQLEFEECNM